MCVAVLRITFRGNDKQLVALETQKELDEKIEAIKDNDQVLAYTVYAKSQKMVKRTTWEEQE